MALAHTAKIVRNGLVLCLDAANSKSYAGSGTTWNDLSGNGNNGTLTNGPAYSSANGGMLTFDGTNDYCQLTSSSSLAMNSFSMSCWFKTNTSADAKIVSLGISHHPLQILNSNFRTCTSGCTAGTAIVVDNTWHFACVVGDATSIRVYIDSNTTPDITQSTNSTVMTGIIRVGSVGAGAGSQPPDYPFNGSISQVFIYNRGLTLAEIQQNYAATRARYSP